MCKQDGEKENFIPKVWKLQYFHRSLKQEWIIDHLIYFPHFINKDTKAQRYKRLIQSHLVSWQQFHNQRQGLLFFGELEILDPRDCGRRNTIK